MHFLYLRALKEKNNKQKNNHFKWQLYKQSEAKDPCWSL